MKMIFLIWMNRKKTEDKIKPYFLLLETVETAKLTKAHVIRKISIHLLKILKIETIKKSISFKRK